MMRCKIFYDVFQREILILGNVFISFLMAIYMSFAPSAFWPLLLVYCIILLVCFLFPWVTVGQISVTFFDDIFFIRSAFTKKIKSYEEIKAICIVQEQIWIRYPVALTRKYNNKCSVKIENKKMRFSKINYYSVCFLSESFDNRVSHKVLQNVLQSNLSVKEYFEKKCLVTVRYTSDLIEELFNHGEFTVYLSNAVLNDINGDIQKLVACSKIKKSKAVDAIFILN
jgi:hypothetical protein